MDVVEKKETRVVGLEIFSDFSAADMSSAQIALKKYGVTGSVAYSAMEALANAIEELEGSVATLKLSIDAESNPMALIRAEIQLEMPLRERNETKSARDELLSKDLGLFKEELGNLAYKRLSNNGINTIADLIDKTPDELLFIRTFGEGCLGKVRSFLLAHDLRLRND